MTVSEKKVDVIRSRIWEEDEDQKNPFVAAVCYCAGYDVYKDILTHASWAEYIYLLFKGEKPTSTQASVLEKLALVLANPGPRDHSVRAAMSGAVGDTTNAACLMAAISVGAGNLNGAREIYAAMEYWRLCGKELQDWKKYIKSPPPREERADVWHEMEHTPGFDPYGVACATPVIQTLDHLASIGSEETALYWLKKHRCELENTVGSPLGFTGVAAAAFIDLKFSAEQSEILYLILRLPGAAVHALEQRTYGLSKYLFFRSGLHLEIKPSEEEK